MQTQQSSRIRMDANEEKSVQKKVLRWNAHSNKIMKLLSHLNYYLLGSVCELALSLVLRPLMRGNKVCISFALFDCVSTLRHCDGTRID